MTRETRIGLLVGLAFIVMFGLVLGELKGPASTVDEEKTWALPQPKEDWLPIIEAPAVEPEPVVQVASREPPKPAPLAREKRSLVLSALVAPDQPETHGAAEMRMLAQQAEPAKPALQTYVVQPNDSLRKIARKVYGSDREELYKRIYKANRNTLNDESLVYVGQELIIPPLAGQAAARPRTNQTTPSRQVALQEQTNRHYNVMNLSQLRERFGLTTSEKVAPSPSGRIYVVQEGDNLSNIARQTLNDDSHSAVKRLYEANKDSLSSPDLLTVGMKLRIPS